MTASVTLARASDAPVARLPLAAILNRGSGPLVYVVDETGALVQRPVTVASFTHDTRAGHVRHRMTATRSSRSACRSSRPG